MSQPVGRAVRAVTIAAPPGRIWPWIMQVGRDRGGFSSYTWFGRGDGSPAPRQRLKPEAAPAG